MPTAHPAVSPPPPLSFLVEEARVCKTADVHRAIDGSPLVAMFIITSTADKATREDVRGHWNAYGVQNGLTVGYAFVLGRPSKQDLPGVLAEAKAHKDLVVLDSEDTYRRLAWKTLGLFQYADKHCGHVKAVVKVDADVVLHIPNLVAGLKAADRMGKLSQPGIIGNIFWRGGLLRNPKHKNHESPLNWPDSLGKMYPAYASGPSYIVTMAAVKEFVHKNTGFNVLSNEDVNTGILAMQRKTPMYKWNQLYFFTPAVAKRKFGTLTDAECGIPVVGVHHLGLRSSMRHALMERWGQCKVDPSKLL